MTHFSEVNSNRLRLFISYCFNREVYLSTRVRMESLKWISTPKEISHWQTTSTII